MDDLKFATSAIALIIFLVLPGISFKNGYFTQRFRNSLNSGSFQDRIISTIFISIIFQIFIILINNSIFETKIEFETYSTFLSEDFIKKNNFNFNLDNLLLFFKYLLFCSLFPFIIGFGLFKFVTFFNLDLFIPYFRSNDYWYYYFRANIPTDDRFRKNIKKVNISDVLVDVLIEIPEGTRLYSGYYVNHTLKPNCYDIDTLILTDITRYSDSRKEFVTVPGNYFKIKGDKIININTRYITNELHKLKTNGLADKILPSLLIIEMVFSFIYPFYINSGILILIINITILLILSLFSTTFFHIVITDKNKVSKKNTSLFLFFVILMFCSIFYIINKGSF